MIGPDLSSAAKELKYVCRMTMQNEIGPADLPPQEGRVQSFVERVAKQKHIDHRRRGNAGGRVLLSSRRSLPARTRTTRSCARRCSVRWYR